MFTATVDLPTPPFPLAMAMMFFTPAMSILPAIEGRAVTWLVTLTFTEFTFSREPTASLQFLLEFLFARMRRRGQLQRKGDCISTNLHVLNHIQAHEVLSDLGVSYTFPRPLKSGLPMLLT